MHSLTPSFTSSYSHARRTPDFRDRLRDCTRDRHALLDAGIDFRRDVTRERYGAFLRGLVAVVSPLEAELTRWFVPEAGPSRSECLLADLARLGASASPVVHASIRLPVDLAQAYGCAYVLEGSTLGGVALAPIVECALGRDTPTSYLRLRAASTGRIWQAWLRKLNAFGEAATQDEIEAACDMACATFDAYTTSLRLTGALIER